LQIQTQKNGIKWTKAGLCWKNAENKGNWQYIELEEKKYDFLIAEIRKRMPEFVKEKHYLYIRGL
jgi:molybdate-binding protein